jgi:hypothetical protein
MILLSVFRAYSLAVILLFSTLLESCVLLRLGAGVGSVANCRKRGARAQNEAQSARRKRGP